MRILSTILRACCDRLGASLLLALVAVTALLTRGPATLAYATTVAGESGLMSGLVVLVTVRVRTKSPRGLHARVRHAETSLARTETRITRVESWIKTEKFVRRGHRADRTPWRPTLTVIDGGLAAADYPTLQLQRLDVPVGERYYGCAKTGC